MSIERFSVNPHGHDFVVGDIHGCFSAVEGKMGEVGFDRQRDRLFSVGDLIDRGPESERVFEWLDYPWFHAVRGNHEDFVCHYETIGADIFLLNGGEWFLDLGDAEKRRLAERFRQLPLAIEVETRWGRIGIVHADCPVRHWQDLPRVIMNPDVREQLLSSRERVARDDTTRVEGIDAIFVGHTVAGHSPVTLGNVIHIDTGGWTGVGPFTLLDLDDGGALRGQI